MKNMLETLSAVLGEDPKKSYLDQIQYIYKENNFTVRQRKIAEEFIFNPCKDTAIKALENSPKIYLFLENYLKKENNLKEIEEDIKKIKMGKTYIKTLFKNEKLKPFVKILCGMDMRNIKVLYMEWQLEAREPKEF